MVDTAVEERAQDVSLSDKDFQTIRQLVYSKVGINLTPAKRNLVIGRLRSILRKRKFASFPDYVEYLKTDRTGKAIVELTDRISTNYTFFYREKEHFEYFSSHVLPELIGAPELSRQKDLRVWCAGCSSGEESYMLQILMIEGLGDRFGRWKAGLLATDISGEALAKAKKGIYTVDQVATVPEALRKKYFKQTEGDHREVIEAVKKEVTHRKFNLMNRTFPFRNPFHVIFCRNVMIYFDRETRDRLIGGFSNALVPGGYLFVGHSESILRNQDDLEYVKPAVYRRKQPG